MNHVFVSLALPFYIYIYIYIYIYYTYLILYLSLLQQIKWNNIFFIYEVGESWLRNKMTVVINDITITMRRLDYAF